MADHEINSITTLGGETTGSLHNNRSVNEVTQSLDHSNLVSDSHSAGNSHGGSHLELGRPLSHPPEPPHLIQFWYTVEQEGLKSQYAADHGIEDYHDIAVIENWLEKDEQGHWQEVEGKSPTIAQTLHVGRLKEEISLIGYAPWENHVYFGLAALLFLGLFYVTTMSFRRDRVAAMKRPTRGQVLIEFIVGSFDEFCKGALGEKNGRKYMPFIGTLFCMVLIGNLMGLFPLLKAPTSSILITFSLAMCTFIVVQGTAWLRLGPGGYIYHLMGQPKDIFGWGLGIIIFLPLEIVSDFIAKPMSLSLRLFGNIFGKDVLLGSFIGMGISLVAVFSESASHYIGVPLTIPFLVLGFLLSSIQALIFALLTTIYIAMVLPHDDHHDEHLEEEVGDVPVTA